MTGQTIRKDSRFRGNDKEVITAVDKEVITEVDKEVYNGRVSFIIKNQNHKGDYQNGKSNRNRLRNNKFMRIGT
jgi:hypothetical protein